MTRDFLCLTRDSVRAFVLGSQVTHYYLSCSVFVKSPFILIIDTVFTISSVACIVIGIVIGIGIGNVSLSVRTFVDLSICLSVCLSVCLDRV